MKAPDLILVTCFCETGRKECPTEEMLDATISLSGTALWDGIVGEEGSNGCCCTYIYVANLSDANLMLLIEINHKIYHNS